MGFALPAVPGPLGAAIASVGFDRVSMSRLISGLKLPRERPRQATSAPFHGIEGESAAGDSKDEVLMSAGWEYRADAMPLLG